jgi:galactose-1-phosphate uridylyltransferase
MNNLIQTQQDAKQAYLTRQAEQMLVIYQNTDQSERNAIIKQIDSFLWIVPKDAKSFG